MRVIQYVETMTATERMRIAKAVAPLMLQLKAHSASVDWSSVTIDDPRRSGTILYRGILDFDAEQASKETRKLAVNQCVNSVLLARKHPMAIAWFNKIPSKADRDYSQMMQVRSTHAPTIRDSRVLYARGS